VNLILKEAIKMNRLTKSIFKAGVLLAVMLSVSGCGIMRRHEMEEAAQRQQAAKQAARNEYQAALQECRARHVSGELKTYVEEVQCANQRFVPAFRMAGFSDMDLIEVYAARRVEIAEAADKKQLTEGQLQVKEAEALKELTEEQRRRGMENASVRNQATTASAAAQEADAVNRQVYTNMTQQGLQMMQPPAAPPPVFRNTTCQSLPGGTTTTCQNY
jgi:hypothetical protein